MSLILPNLKYKNIGLVFALALIFIIPDILFAETNLYKYAINLESSEVKNPTLLNLKDFNVKNNYKVYQTEVGLGRNKSFYRLRVGFFKSKREASLVASKFKSKYSKLWIDRLHKQDRKILLAWIDDNKTFEQTENIVDNKEDKSSKVIIKDKSAKQLMARAKNAMKNKKYRLAAGLYTRVISIKNTSYRQQAMEFLGLAREKNGQLIHARAEYRLYLKEYPKGEDYLRVRQRLLSLKTLLLKPRKRLKKGSSKRSDWQLFGSVLQFYRLDSFNSNQTSINNETLSTNANFLARKRTESLNIKSQFNASHLAYLSNTSSKDKARINTLFVDVADLNNNKSIRLGRQSQSKGGVLGKMDGAWVGYRLTPSWKVNAVAGLPVQTSTSNKSQKNRPFWGISADISTEAKNWNFSAYTINQKTGTLTDRNAIGGEVRYRKGKQNHFALMDYDTYFSELNTFFYVGNWRFDNNAAIIFTLNHRNSPILTTNNALQGQTTSPSIDALLQTYSESEIKQFAKDRTSKYNSSSLSTSIPLSNKWTFSTDVTLSNLSSTPSSANVVGLEGTGNELYYSAQFIGYDIFSANETTRYQIRYSDTKTYERTQLTVSSRFRLKNKKWRLRPQISTESRVNKKGGNTTKLKPSLRVDYKIKKRLKLEMDFSYEAAKTTAPVKVNENNYYISAGYIWDF